MNANGNGGMTRRAFLHQATAFSVGFTVAAGRLVRAADAGRPKIPVGVQLYSVRELCAKDLAGTLAQVARIGYKGVEWAGYHNRSARELRKMLDDLGLVTCGTHTPYESILPDKLEATIEFNQILGNRFLIVPWMEGRSREEWLEKARLFNEVADKVRSRGMYVGYHAHAHDFQKFDGQTAWDLFFGNTHPDVVMQLDTSNCMAGGADPVEVLRRYPGRALTIHIKSHGGGPEAVFGEDKVNWPAVFEWCETRGGTQWYVVEHETSKDPMDAIRRAFAALQKMGKV
ncbi:sugar phosphate isomerase/epimerase family protein [Limisphaera sp. 4302-co]|uniref:sugar phosphate isomerase/epimerase family protein n=1 Tax=Limisphaera sp. 4302-co TaxID=3400417 RepID=UPI003C25187D